MEGIVLRFSRLWVDDEEAEAVKRTCGVLVGEVCVWEERE